MTKWQGLRLWLKANRRHPSAPETYDRVLARMRELDAVNDAPGQQEEREPRQQALEVFA